jgi:hypothetical protein
MNRFTRASFVAVAAFPVAALFAVLPSSPAAAQGAEEAAATTAGGNADGTTAVVPAAALAEDADVAARPADLSYGVSLGLRWISVPAWTLDLFTKKNVPLSSWGTAVSFFRRKENFDVIGTLSYTNASPADGNWLGKGDEHPAAVDTDFVQFRGLALYALDVSFVWHTMFNDWFGIHYGAGVGIAYVGGRILRTSSSGCTEDNAGDLSQCRPQGVDCGPGGCNEQQLIATSVNPGTDNPANPKRFRESSVPPVLPIVNVVVGVDFRLPKVRGWEAKLEGGFYDAFFLGGGIAYTF